MLLAVLLAALIDRFSPNRIDAANPDANHHVLSNGRPLTSANPSFTRAKIRVRLPSVAAEHAATQASSPIRPIRAEVHSIPCSCLITTDAVVPTGRGIGRDVQRYRNLLKRQLAIYLERQNLRCSGGNMPSSLLKNPSFRLARLPWRAGFKPLAHLTSTRLTFFHSIFISSRGCFLALFLPAINLLIRTRMYAAPTMYAQSSVRSMPL
jgi:hypothetical protein